MLLINLKKKISFFVKPLSKTSFLQKLNGKSTILDVGCGNNSPKRTKLVLPECIYTGIDVINYKQNEYPNKSSENLIFTISQEFCKVIKNLPQEFDAIISCHNLEHCEDRYGVLEAMCQKLKPDGLIYISFPSVDSINFPSRKGTLNYYDDKTHRDAPPDFDKVLKILKQNNMKILKKSKNNKPILMNIYGTLIEPLSIIKNKVYLGTWEKWGFESIFIAQKKH